MSIHERIQHYLDGNWASALHCKISDELYDYLNECSYEDMPQWAQRAYNWIEHLKETQRQRT
jgi:hypothetical protein